MVSDATKRSEPPDPYMQRWKIVDFIKGKFTIFGQAKDRWNFFFLKRFTFRGHFNICCRMHLLPVVVLLTYISFTVPSRILSFLLLHFIYSFYPFSIPCFSRFCLPWGWEGLVGWGGIFQPVFRTWIRLDPHSIWAWIRIRIRNPDPDSGSSCLKIGLKSQNLL